MPINRTKILKNQFSKNSIGGSVSINDIREKDFAGKPLTSFEKQALRNYDHYRIRQLENLSGTEFHEKYRLLQVMANLEDYKEFLKEKYWA
jgi:hypothetical protein